MKKKIFLFHLRRTRSTHFKRWQGSLTFGLRILKRPFCFQLSRYVKYKTFNHDKKINGGLILTVEDKQIRIPQRICLWPRFGNFLIFTFKDSVCILKWGGCFTRVNSQIYQPKSQLNIVFLMCEKVKIKRSWILEQNDIS